MPDKSYSPPPIDLEAAKNRALAALRQGVWESSQFLTEDETREYVESVMDEIESDHA